MKAVEGGGDDHADACDGGGVVCPESVDAYAGSVVGVDAMDQSHAIECLGPAAYAVGTGTKRFAMG